MAVLFSNILLSADNGSTDSFLCGGIPDKAEDFENWTTYQNFLEDNPEIEAIDVEVKSYVYGDGELMDANEHEVAYFTMRGESFLKRSTVRLYDESNFIILTDNENIEMEM